MSDLPFEKRRQEVFGRSMAYVEVGEGDPIVFLHGNPTSSYLWRNVIPHLAGLGRCIAPDLIGMGDSEKLPDSGPDAYRFVEHRRYIEGLLEAIGVRERVTLVLHDWGCALGLDWANHHREAVRGIAYMEGIVVPRLWSDWPEPTQQMFRQLRSDAGEQLILQDNMFVETLLPRSMLRTLTDTEMNEYRRPFLEAGESRRPTLTWPREIPVDGEPADVTAIVQAFADHIPASTIPKLFINGDPGQSLSGRLRDFCRTWNAQTEVTVRGRHFLPEDSPNEVGQAVAAWLRTLP